MRFLSNTALVVIAVGAASAAIAPACINVDDVTTACASDPSQCWDATRSDAHDDGAVADIGDSARSDIGDVGSDVTIDSPTDALDTSDVIGDAACGECVPGTVDTVAGACPGVFEKKLRTCAGDCSWGAPTCRIPSGWKTMSASPLAARSNPGAVWTGTQMIVWGGQKSDKTIYYADGARYDLATDTWVAIAAAPSGLLGRVDFATAWTGSQMIIWGGQGASGAAYADGAAYEPSSDSWKPLATAPLSARVPGYAYATTTGDLLIWGAADGTIYVNDGASYHAPSDHWAALTASPLSVRSSVGSVWSGTQLVVFGGANGSTFFNDGASYNALTSSWTALSAAPSGYTPRIWSGQASVKGGMMVLGGYTASGASLADGIYFDASGVAQLVPAVPGTILTSPDRVFPQVWCDGTDRCWYWSGAQLGGGSPVVVAGGASYSLSTKAWSAMTSVGEPSPRARATSLWTGKSAILWGGGTTPDGAIFTP